MHARSSQSYSILVEAIEIALRGTVVPLSVDGHRNPPEFDHLSAELKNQSGLLSMLNMWCALNEMSTTSSARAVSIRPTRLRERLGSTPKALRVRHCNRCEKLFFLCKKCDRGQRYCDAVCRTAGQQAMRRSAAARYRQTAEGKAGQRDRQRAFRERREANGVSVTHQGSANSMTMLLHWIMYLAARLYVVALQFSEADPPKAVISNESSLCACCGALSVWTERATANRRRLTENRLRIPLHTCSEFLQPTSSAQLRNIAPT